jgi:glycosyltransferase involved in cell wall biosynthesis
MYKNKKIGISVPAHNEEHFIGNVIDTMPVYVDKIYVVNDLSTDNTEKIVKEKVKNNNKLILINRSSQGGVGAAVLTGHRKGLEDGMEIMVVMAGDGQMDPEILFHFLDPIIEKKADYTKGNRLSNSRDKKEMPAWRAFGNFLLTNLSRISTGYWHISDPQNGYTAISSDILKKINFEKIENGFAFENDILVKLNVLGARVMDINHSAVYRGQKSKIRYRKFIIQTSWILLRNYIWRIWMKYFK